MLRPHKGHLPRVDPSAYVDPSAQLIGRVSLGVETSVWCNVTMRGDVDEIRVGDGSNVQDNSVLHCDEGVPCTIGKGVVVGHSATVHGCTVEDDCLIGMGATILNHAVVGSGSIVAAGALVPERAQIPPRSMVMGVPGKVRREISDQELEAIRENARHYVEHSREYLAESNQ